MFESFLIQSFIALIFATISCSLLGVFVVWQRISYFGDALSHALLLGLAIGATIDANPILATAIFSIAFALLVFFANDNRHLSKDSSIMIVSYFSIALAIIFNDLWIQNLDFSSYIFGDILAVGMPEIIALSIVSIATVIYAAFGKNKIMLINLNADLAKISGIKNKYWELSFLAILALTIAITTHVVGIFLTTALLILPAAIARFFAKSAKKMLIISLAIGIIGASSSFVIANKLNLTIGPVVIIGFCVVLFLTRSALFLRK